MNYNINIRMDKVMDKLSRHKILRRWSYSICILLIIAIIAWKSPDIINAIADYRRVG